MDSMGMQPHPWKDKTALRGKARKEGHKALGLNREAQSGPAIPALLVPVLFSLPYQFSHISY